MVSTPGLDPRVQCIQLPLGSRWTHSFVLPTLHDRNISLYREVYAKQGTQQHRWFLLYGERGIDYRSYPHTRDYQSPNFREFIFAGSNSTQLGHGT